MINSEYHRKISVAEMAPHVHSFLPSENKVDKIANWLINWIKLSLDNRKIQPLDFLPAKGDLACHIGVSLGTMQNAYRKVEDLGYIESKQRIGTYIKVLNNKNKVKKLTSKRELAIEIVKKYILESNIAIGEKILSSRKLAILTGFSNATLRLAINSLVQDGILKKEKDSFFLVNNKYNITTLETKTLVEKTAESIEEYINENLQSGDRLPTNSQLIKIFGVSTKTIHDAIKILSKNGLVHTRRGKYGTIVLGNSSEEFQTETYHYEKIEKKIRQYISQQCQIGDKLPSIKKFADTLETSEKTVKKALDLLAEDGYLTFARGRYGGTFVTDIPQISSEAYKWLAFNTDYFTN